MAIGQKHVTIHGTEYLITHFPAMRGTRVLKQLTKLIGPSFATLQAGGDLGTALNILFDNLDQNVEQLIVELVSTCSKGSVGINFDMEFAGEYDKLFLLVKEVVDFNFGSVFTLLGSAV
ncbi:hypothetical protein uav_102 [Pseudomonas phage UAVern]|uniref:Uncharacterized protein n=1 Tax=Pseudomonas phage UAVern TaxID=2856997 RepID=A0A975UUT4_9CAUD|nr:hypothetical protein uav_102 [Pseudomonas phage UAVern]